MTSTEPRSADEFLQPRRWTRDEYYALYDADFFDEQNVELLDGEIWRLPPQSPLHVFCILQAIDLLKAVFGTGFNFRQRGPMTVNEFTEPDPDVLVVPGSWHNYEDHHPAPPEVCLLLEVSDDGTLAKDRSKKLGLYAQAGITDYWIVNLVNRQLEVYRNSAEMSGGYGYKTMLTLLDGDSIAPLSAPNGIVAAIDLFPPVERPK